MCITSFNSTGFGPSAQNFISTLLVFSDIVCLQEHFLLDSKDKKHSNTNLIRQKFGGSYDMHIVPAHKSNDQVSRGRGKGGLATIFRKHLTKYAEKIPCSNFRLLGTKFSFPNSSILLINCYFPCDPRKDNYDDSELLDILTDIDNLIRKSQCSDIILAGDLNCHFQRQTRFTSTVERFFKDLSLLIVWQNPNQKIMDIDYTFSNITRGVISTSRIDHFITSQRVYDIIQEAGVIHTGENNSNHSPIYVKLRVEDLDLSVEKAAVSKRIFWDKANSDAKENYKAVLSEKLSLLNKPECLNCGDFHCSRHSDDIDHYTLEVMEAIEESAKECLPVSGCSSKSKNKSVVAGWSDHVKPYAEDSKFWFSVWKSLGKPRHGDIFHLKSASHRQYKYAVHRLKRVNDKIRNEVFKQLECW